VELRVMCAVYRMLQHPANRTHNPQLRNNVVPPSSESSDVNNRSPKRLLWAG